MINSIIKFHGELEQGETVKIITCLKGYETYVNRTDLLKESGDILEIYRANGAKVAINTAFIISCCVIRRL